MRRLLCFIVAIFIANNSNGQPLFLPSGLLAEDPTDSVLMKYPVTSTPSRISTTINKKGSVEEIWCYDSCLIFHYRPVPLGYWCDTAWEEKVGDLQHCQFTIFFDRRVVVRFQGYVRREWSWDAWVDTSFFSRVSRLR